MAGLSIGAGAGCARLEGERTLLECTQEECFAPFGAKNLAFCSRCARGTSSSALCRTVQQRGGYSSSVGSLRPSTPAPSTWRRGSWSESADSLLQAPEQIAQSVQSLTLRFQLVVDELPARADACLALEAAIDRADQVIAEGRDRVLALRMLQETRDIETILADLGKRQGFDLGIAVSILADGTRRPLAPLVLDEVSYIAGEALYNIWRHAWARQVMIEIGHHSEFSLHFLDNGVDPMAE